MTSSTFLALRTLRSVRPPRPTTTLTPRLTASFATITPTTSSPPKQPTPTPAPSTITSVLKQASAASPLKDAVKFVRPDAKSTVWTFRELVSHVEALSSGLRALHYTPSDKIVTFLPSHSPEASVFLLAAARLHLTVIAVPLPDNPSATSSALTALSDAINTHRPRMVVVTHDVDVSAASATIDGERASPGDGGGVAGIFASSNGVVDALAGDAALRDAAGVAGLAPMTGRPFRAARFPSIQHMVHTGDANIRSAITFRSLLVYNSYASTPDSSVQGATDGDVRPLLVRAGEGGGGGGMTEKEVLMKAGDIAGRLALSSDHGRKEGKVVVRADGSGEAVAGAVAALMRQALWLQPHPDSFDDVCKEEDAVVA